ncbi:hypothetical protein V8C86DRAFT_2892272 [Haematococcus lacustris]
MMAAAVARDCTAPRCPVLGEGPTPSGVSLPLETLALSTMYGSVALLDAGSSSKDRLPGMRDPGAWPPRWYAFRLTLFGSSPLVSRPVPVAGLAAELGRARDRVWGGWPGAGPCPRWLSSCCSCTRMVWLSSAAAASSLRSVMLDACSACSWPTSTAGSLSKPSPPPPTPWLARSSSSALRTLLADFVGVTCWLASECRHEADATSPLSCWLSLGLSGLKAAGHDARDLWLARATPLSPRVLAGAAKPAGAAGVSPMLRAMFSVACSLAHSAALAAFSASSCC